MKTALGELRSSPKKLQQYSEAKKPNKRCTKMVEQLCLACILPSPAGPALCREGASSLREFTCWEKETNASKQVPQTFGDTAQRTLFVPPHPEGNKADMFMDG